jgi:hypothetical protein
MIVAKSGYAQSLDKPMALGIKSPATSVVAVCDFGVATMSAVIDTPLQLQNASKIWYHLWKREDVIGFFELRADRG